MSVTGTMFSNAAITNPFLDGSAGRNPLGAINALNTMHFGGAASTQEFVTNAYLQGIGVGPSPFGIGGPPPLKRELNGFFMQGNPLVAGQADLGMNGMSGAGFAQSPGIGMWQPASFDLATGFQPQGISQQFAGMPNTAQFGGAVNSMPFATQSVGGFGGMPIATQTMGGFTNMPMATQFSGAQLGGMPTSVSPYASQAAVSFAPTQAQFSGVSGFPGATQFAASPFGGAGAAMPVSQGMPQTAYQIMPQATTMSMPPQQQFMQNFWGGAQQFFGGVVHQTTAFFGGFSG